MISSALPHFAQLREPCQPRHLPSSIHQQHQTSNTSINRAYRTQTTAKTDIFPPHRTTAMSGRTRNVAQETSERAAELDNKVKWLDLLKADAIERTRAVTAQYTQAFKAL
jgi:hypothetical protein